VSLKEVTSKTAIQVLLSNEAQIGVFGGSLVLSAAAQGANLRYFATLTPVVTFSLYAQPRYASAAKLRGQRVGVSSTGGSNYAGAFLGLKALGLSPSDVNIASLGSSSNVDSALLSGTIAAGVGHPPAAAKFRAKGLVELVDLVKKKIPFAFVGISARTKFASSHKDVVRAFLVGLLQGIHREKSDKSLAEREIRKHFDLSKQKNLDSVYDYYAKRVVPNVPRVSRAQFETEIEIFSGQNPDIKSVNLDKVINKSYLASAVKEANRTK
jgi:ABC-type nitrate/sulfonate/bicarbonate transport system substrate-binding protein